LDLLSSDAESFVILAAEDQLRKLRRPRHVGAFADVQEAHLRAQGQRLEPAQPRMRLDLRTDSGFQSANRLLDRLNMLRGCPAASADNVHPSACGKIAQHSGGFVGGFVVTAESVWQARVRMATKKHRRDARKLLDIRTHLLSTKRAIDAHRQKPGMRHRVPEGFDRPSRTRAAA